MPLTHGKMWMIQASCKRELSSECLLVSSIVVKLRFQLPADNADCSSSSQNFPQPSNIGPLPPLPSTSVLMARGRPPSKQAGALPLAAEETMTPIRHLRFGTVFVGRPDAETAVLRTLQLRTIRGAKLATASRSRRQARHPSGHRSKRASTYRPLERFAITDSRLDILSTLLTRAPRHNLRVGAGSCLW